MAGLARLLLCALLLIQAPVSQLLMLGTHKVCQQLLLRRGWQWRILEPLLSVLVARVWPGWEKLALILLQYSLYLMQIRTSRIVSLVLLFPARGCLLLSKNVPYATIADIDFSTPKQKRKKLLEQSLQSTDNASYKRSNIQPSEDDHKRLYKKLSDCGKLVFLSIVPNFLEAYVSLSEQDVLPKPLTSLFSE